MRKLTSALFSIVLILSAGSGATAQTPGDASPKTYTWTLVESSDAALLWPNASSFPNLFEADGGLLARVNPEWVLAPGEDIFTALPPDSCSLPPSYPCQAGSPPAWLLPPGSGEPGGWQIECNRKVVACNTVPTSVSPHDGHLPGGAFGDPAEGEFSFLFLSSAFGTSVAHGMGFLSGSYSYVQQPYRCNGCPPTGHGKDIENQMALGNPGASAQVQTLGVNLWSTQIVEPFGHTAVTLQGAGPGEIGLCGNGVAFQDLIVDWCHNGLAPGSGDFVVPSQKVIIKTYSIYLGQHATFQNPGRCNPPDCFIENVIIPTAIFQSDGAARNIQMLRASSRLPGNIDLFSNATVDSILFAYTTQLLDMDGDGTEDRVDPCPNDATDFCRLDLSGGGSCPAGTVFCLDAGGATASCKAGALCETRLDVDRSCQLRAADVNAVSLSVAYNSALSIGPFDP